MKSLALAVFFISTIAVASAQQRARDLGIKFNGTTGQYNAITDVKGVLVGYKTLISGDEPLVTGKGPVRTGVTVIMPNGKSIDPLPAGWFSLNGDGEMTGTTVIDEYGLNYGPIGITNTNSVGVVRDAIGEWNIKNFSKGATVDFSFGLPVAAETFDGILNDINGLHVKKEDVFDALNIAHGGKIEEGNVGGGTGMSLFLFKGGSGTSSRVIKIDTANYTVGVFVQGNFGGRKDLVISGVPVGQEWKGDMPIITSKPKDGSIIIIIGTDAPLLPAQLKLVAKRASLGVARCGGIGRNGSGDIFLAFSTVPPKDNTKGTLQTWTVLPKEQLDKVYQATVESVEEAIVNAMIAAKDMKGINGNTVYAIPHDKLMQVINSYSHKAQ
jgi:L-aminopeptidase/D-esterase-like protein